MKSSQPTVSIKALTLPATTPPHNTLNSVPAVPGIKAFPIGLSRKV